MAKPCANLVFKPCELLNASNFPCSQVLECENMHLSNTNWTLHQLQHTFTNCNVSKFDDLIKPDPDIAGQGIVISFIAIGSVVMLLAIAQVVRNLHQELTLEETLVGLFYPQVDKLRDDESWASYADAKRFVDQERSNEAQDDLKRGGQTSALSSTLFGLADTQFVTGIAIAVAALAKPDITAYHYFVCIELAWLALLTSTVGLLATRLDILGHSGGLKRFTRIIVMWVLFVMLFCLEYRRNDDLAWTSHVYEHSRYWRLTDWRGILSLLLLIQSTVAVVLDTLSLFSTPTVFMYYYIEGMMVKSADHVKSALEGSPTPQANTAWLSRIVNSARKIFVLVCASLFWSIVWFLSLVCYWGFFHPPVVLFANVLFFIWGATDAFKWSREGKDCMKPEDYNVENQFGFGQIVALIVLIGPVIANVDLWHSSCKRWWTRKKNHRVSTMEVISEGKSKSTSQVVNKKDK